MTVTQRLRGRAGDRARLPDPRQNLMVCDQVIRRCANKQVAKSFLRRKGARQLASTPSRGESFAQPAPLGAAGVAQPVVQPARPALPELDRVGADAVAAPV